eukprot:365017-Chlamydomonas_euryale.AAC.6
MPPSPHPFMQAGPSLTFAISNQPPSCQPPSCQPPSCQPPSCQPLDTYTTLCAPIAPSSERA